MKLKLLLLSIMSLFTLTSHALDIVAAKIDGRSGHMILDVIADCNIHEPVLRHNFSNKRIDGPHYFTLGFRQTERGCGGNERLFKQIRMKLPRNMEGQTVNIRYRTVTLQYVGPGVNEDQEVKLIPAQKPAPIEYWNPVTQPKPEPLGGDYIEATR